MGYSGVRWDTVFRGVNQLSLDAKGRLSVPSQYREGLNAQVVITIDTEEQCLMIYPLVRWLEIEKQIEALPSFDKAARRVKRLLLGHATDVNIDSNGRLLVPAPLREYAQLDQKKVVLIGQGQKLELWNEERWSVCRETWLKEEREVQALRPDSLLAISL